MGKHVKKILRHIFEKVPDFAEISWNIVYFITTTNPSSLSKFLTKSIITTSVPIIHMYVVWHVAMT